MRLRNVAWISALVLVASALAGVGAPRLLHADTSTPPAGTLSVTGTGTVETQPDTATFSAGVSSQAAKAADAMAANASAMTKLIAALTAAGIEPKDLQTQLVSLDPRYDDTGQNLLGYTASNSVAATVRDVSRAGALIDAAAAAGATSISGPSLARDDQDQLYRDALADAVAKARLKANALARATGLTLGDVRSVSEVDQSTGPIAYATDAKALGASTPIETGTAEISASVRVVFAVS